MSPYTAHRGAPAQKGKVLSETSEVHLIARLPPGRKPLTGITPRHFLSLPLQATLLCHKDSPYNRDRLHRRAQMLELWLILIIFNRHTWFSKAEQHRFKEYQKAWARRQRLSHMVLVNLLKGALPRAHTPLLSQNLVV